VLCLSEESILAFVEGRLGVEELAGVEAHARECPLCDELIAAAFTTPAAKAQPPWATLPPGTRIGRYTALDLVGVGGMSEVYAAYDPDLDRKIAVKLLRAREPRRDVRDQARLMKEAQATARLSHPNVVTVHDVGTFGERVFIAMEYVEGHTLASWTAAREHDWRQIVATFADAGRGLAAAHAAGLVHRDFKPQNVMVGRDGLVRVMDFGLAKRIDAGAPAEEGKAFVRAHGHAEMSRGSSEIAGTPAFMAPEQLTGGVVDARSDQFSFCLALHLALYGAHPFLDDNAASASTAARAMARIKPAPSRRAVPVRLRRVIARGLSVVPARRWPSMDDLVKALLASSSKRRRNGLVVLAAAFALAAGAAIAGRVARSGPSPCERGGDPLAEAWGRDASSGRRAAVRGAFFATGKRAAPAIWERASALLDSYAGAWLRMRRDACEATHVRGEQSAEILDLRMSCLDERRDALMALTAVLAKADDAAVNNAVDAIRALPALNSCADVRMLRAVGAPSLSPDLAARATDLRRRAAAVKIILDVGDQRVGLQRAKGLLAEARAVGYAPLTVEMMILVGRFEDDMSFFADASALLQEAGRIALAARRDDLAAEAYVNLVAVEGQLHAADGLVWANIADALLDRTGHAQDRLRSWLLHNRAVACAGVDDLKEAERLFRQTVALKERVFPPGDPDILRTLADQAEILHRAGRDAEALEVTARACPAFAVAYGLGSKMEAMCLSNHGEYLLALGRASEAKPVFERALSHWEADVGPEHRFVAYALTGIGRALLALGRFGEALPVLERALRIRQAEEPDRAMKAETQFALAQALWATGGTERAARLAIAATENYESQPTHQRDASEVQAWRSHHRPRRAARYN
jgi:tRNA A-37 threonylcarbamoyl transferase component Bud32/tetratricopeptide (TPR) repeat protein